MHCDTHILSTYVNLKKTRHNHSFSIIAIQFCLQKHEFFYIGNTIHYLLLLVLNNRPCSNNGTQIHRPLFFLQNWVLTINILLMNHASLKTSRKSSKSNVNLSPKVCFKIRYLATMKRLIIRPWFTILLRDDKFVANLSFLSRPRSVLFYLHRMQCI